MDHRITQSVLASLERAPQARSRRVLEGLVRHLHAFAREVELTDDEWLAGVRFLTAAGQKCDDRRQEFILISDVLGLSMLLNDLNHDHPGATEGTVLGPFHVEGAREIANGGDLAAGWPGERARVSGTVRDVDGRPIAGARLEVWQADSEGLYDTQRPTYPERQLRAWLRADDQGRYAFITLRPTSYPVPTDGPAGALLEHMGRHPYRPAHIHFIVEAPKRKRLVTHIFAAGDPYLGSDAVFGVKTSLIVDFFREQDTGTYEAQYDFVLEATPDSECPP